MSRARNWSIALVVCGVAAGAADAQAAPVLAGKNVITASGSKAMVVTLPQDLSLSDQARPTVSFAGGVPWRAVALYALAPTDGAHPLLALEQFSDRGTSPPDFPPRLPAGDYVLLLAAATSAERVTATLHLAALDGEASFNPSTPIPLHHTDRAIRPSASDPDTAVVSAMHPAQGATFGGMIHTRANHPWVGSEQQCRYTANREDQPSDAEPGCPGGEARPGPISPQLVPPPSVNAVEGTATTQYAWSYPKPQNFGIGWNFSAIAGDVPEVSLESWWIDFAEAPAALLALSKCAADADAVAPEICAHFAPFRRPAKAADRFRGRFSKDSAERFGVSRQLVRRLATTKIGPLYLAPGLESSCAVLVVRRAHSTLTNCRENKFLLSGEIAFAFTGRSDRTVVAALLPDGARRVRLKLTNGARGTLRFRGNAAIVYTSFKRYRGGSLLWRDASGKRHVTRFPGP